VVGAIFGQTEGLLGPDLDLRELQRTGRIGRIEVNIASKVGKTDGTILIPSSLDKVETAILAASLETIEQVGPCESKVAVTKIEDVRISKRKKIIDRAKTILTTMVDENNG
jgi:DNA primase